jgi:hypothetical protein
MSVLSGILVVHAAATLMMTGLIWFVQVVHYPLMQQVGPGGYIAYQKAHMQRTTWVVAPLMLAEGLTACVLALLLRSGPRAGLAWLNLGLVAGIWLSTAFLQVPCHRRLEQGLDITVARRLVRGNWLRTAIWSLHALAALALLAATDATL